jgi:hypothetical protein
MMNILAKIGSFNDYLKNLKLYYSLERFVMEEIEINLVMINFKQLTQKLSSSSLPIYLVLPGMTSVWLMVTVKPLILCLEIRLVDTFQKTKRKTKVTFLNNHKNTCLKCLNF